jgi:hypothetical protein
MVDILIDDGGHKSRQQRVTLEEMLPHIAPGGLYVCEDIHGVHNNFSSFLFGFIDSLNNWGRLSGESVIPIEFQRWIKSIHFYPYITVIEKAETPAQRLIAFKRGTEWQPFL